MATIITVHGTFAHEGGVRPPGAPAPATGVLSAPAGDRQWWQPGSAFDAEVARLVEAHEGTVEIKPFEWSGANSELGRRDAGRRLLGVLTELEARKEPYCLIGHSHGGSVISAALLEAAGRKLDLPGLKRWITVGTPFVKLERERWLFARLDLVRKAIFIASMMLFLMFAVYLAADVMAGEPLLFGATFPGVLAVMGLMMSLPILVFYLLLRYLDGRGTRLYSRRATARAKASFGPRWLPFTHAEDEAIQGLAFLPGAKLYFFDRSFAVAPITFASVFALPLLYLAVVTSPSTMVSIADWLKTAVYDGRVDPGAEKAVQELRQRLQAGREAMAARRQKSERQGRTLSEEERRAVWVEYRSVRSDLAKRFPDLASAERAYRFRARFFERDGKPCDGAKLCGQGHDLRINSGLLLHVVTDELAWSIGGAEVNEGPIRWLWSLIVPALLVPVLSGLVALVLLMITRSIARVVSRLSSHGLNALTNAEVKRAAFGNDTEGEIATGAIDRPMWLDATPPRLPSAIAAEITSFSNDIAGRSVAKFRNAIGRLASVDPKHTADTAITTYFTWKELVHSAYFDVPQFRRLVLQAVSRTEGFKPSPLFRADPDFTRSAQWLAEIEGAPRQTRGVAETPPAASDAGAVAAVVASTVKAEP
jgi:hypothetical protein